MGLAGRKDKQRIGTDPRNLTWADDAAKFGQSYLTKMGWDPSRGLGASGDGRTSHIKVAQKFNLLGIGAGVAGARGEADGVAWKQNREYEILLKRLNEGLREGGGGGEDGKEETGKEEEEEVVSEKTKKKKKRKRVEDVEAYSDEKTKKKTKDPKDRKEKKKEKKSLEKVEEELVDKKLESKPEAEPPNSIPAIQAPTPRHMAHRARFLRSKQLASRSSTAVAEILGISTSASNSPNPSSFPVSLAGSSSATPLPPSSESSTPVSARVPETDQEIRTSNTSVGDYFKAKLAARVKSTGPPANASASSSSGTISPTSMVPGVARDSAAELDYDRPPAGIGSSGVLYGKVRAAGDGDTPRGGLGMKFGGLMGLGSASQGGSSVVPGASETTASAVVTEDANKESSNGDEIETKKSKKTKDKKKGKNDGESNSVEKDGSSAPVDAEVSAKEKRRKEKAERKAKKRNEKEKKGRREDSS